MPISDSQKVDYLWKKLGYGKTKTDTNANKRAPNEAIDSPLLMRGDTIWTQADLIPSTIPASTSAHVRIYTGTSAIETTEDNTSTANRTWKTGETDWIPPEFGSTYLIKVYTAASGTANPSASGTQLFATGSGNNDEWFFDYQSGVLHFIGTNIPSSVASRKVFIEGARYIGNIGIGSANNFSTVSAKILEANTVVVSPETKITRANNTITSTNTVVGDTATINTLKLGNHQDNGVLIGRVHNKRIGFVTGNVGEFFQVAANGTPTFGDIDAETY